MQYITLITLIVVCETIALYELRVDIIAEGVHHYICRHREILQSILDEYQKGLRFLNQSYI